MRLSQPQSAPKAESTLVLDFTGVGCYGLRRRRNELEYPLYPTEQATVAEAAETLKTAAEIIDSATKLLPNLGFF